MEIPAYIRDLIKERGAEPDTIPIIKSRAEYRDFAGRYGPPNLLPNADGTVDFKNGAVMFVDDDQDGKPVAVSLGDNAP